eukprot:CAMPEP_0175995150 /NCGR_PEP_ID=MMETSP0108-20121206/54978_1 /TAXON_ID=195067 ORGANISM="Goniomonas pacifica, Strain CCMP1869" /NCGR_SAMPLE_ID=MMETSP0108 /ASSEMBLY_ACC=CAM_ASM_000204 /LENGTH=242 /DNA_ID=CAMNT_0017327253 /DNA_START=7 /DNA_END=737 /DNA_ORIENTATION=+
MTDARALALAAQVKTDMISVIAFSLFTALFAEAVNYFFVHRSEEYNRLKRNMEALQNEVNKKKAQLGVLGTGDKKGPQDKQIRQIEVPDARGVCRVYSSARGFILLPRPRLNVTEVGENNEHGLSDDPFSDDVNGLTGITFITSLSFMSQQCASRGCYRAHPNSFDGRPVARLPFEPYGFVKSFAQRGLPENGDVYACSYALLYVLASAIMRNNLQKIFGFSTPPASPAAGLFGLPNPNENK